MLFEMREDPVFHIGHIEHNGYRDLAAHPTLRALLVASCLEAQPGWTDWPYKAFGGASPARSYLESGSIQGRMPESHSARVQTLILDAIFARLADLDDAGVASWRAYAGRARDRRG